MDKVILNTINEKFHYSFGPLLESKFKYTPRGPLSDFIQKICFWILKKLKCQIQDTRIEYSRMEIPLDDLFNAVIENRIMMEMLYNKEAKYLVLGRDHYKKFMKCLFTKENMIRFQTPFDYKARVLSSNGVRQEDFFQGLNIVFVPYLDGMFCLPDLGRLNR